jgi:peptidoglycan/xylan/chitin deacetylase (PgdA/CDA1 family)
VQDFPFDQYEIIVVADGCTDGTEKLLRSFIAPCAFRWYEQSNQGSPAAQNLGVAHARGEFVLFVDDDCICESGLIRAHQDAHLHADKLLVIGVIKIHPDSPRGILYDLKREEDPEGLRMRTVADGRTDLMLCANSSISRQAALDCPFDPSYDRIHDVVAGEQLRRKGFTAHLEPKAIAHELFTKNVKSFLRDSRLQGKHEVRLVANEPAFKPLAALTCLNSGNLLKRTARALLSAYPRTSDFGLRLASGILQPLSAIPAVSRVLRRILAARSVVALISGAIQEAGSWARVKAVFGLRIPVIMYHNVGAPLSGEYPGITMPVSEFESQVSYLSRWGYRTIQPAEWLAWRDKGGTLPERPVMLVFDDAYADASRNAFPVLERHGFTAACMVVTRYIGSTNHWDQLLGRPSQELMSESEILEWSERGFEFGGHSCSHIYFPDSPEEFVRQEICECKTELGELIGREVTSFAYPYSAVTQAAYAAVRDNFQLAFTVKEGLLDLSTDPYLVPRFEFLPGETRFGIWCHLHFGNNAFVYCRNLRSKIRRVVARFAST